MVLILFMPGFGIHDCPEYYQKLVKYLGSRHTIRFLHVDGYTYSGRRYLGDVRMSDVLRACVDICRNIPEPYVLMGHSTGALVAGQLYPLLERKPIKVLLINPLTNPPRLWCIWGKLPMITSLMWLVNWVPVPLVTYLYTACEVGTPVDVVRLMKFQLWRDITASSCVLKAFASLPTTATIVTGVADNLGLKQPPSNCVHIESAYPGHTSFRSMQCLKSLGEILSDPISDFSGLFDDLYAD